MKKKENENENDVFIGSRVIGIGWLIRGRWSVCQSLNRKNKCSNPLLSLILIRFRFGLFRPGPVCTVTEGLGTRPKFGGPSCGLLTLILLSRVDTKNKNWNQSLFWKCLYKSHFLLCIICLEYLFLFF